MSNGKSIDIIKPLPPKPRNIDWDALFQEFLLQDRTTAITEFLRDTKHWSVAQITSGNTTEHTTGWGKLRASKRQELLDARMADAKAAFADLMPQIQSAKRAIIEYYLDLLINGHPRRDYKKETDEIVDWREPLSMRDRSHILTKLKTELGEPAVITKTSVDDNGQYRDPAMAVLIALGVFVDRQQTTTTIPGYEPPGDDEHATDADVSAPQDVA